VMPDHLDAYRLDGFTIACIGHEAIVDLRTFQLAGKAGREFRPQVRRLTNLGYETVVLAPPLSAGQIEELRLVSDEWLARMHGVEKRFSLGWFDDDYLRRCPVMVVRTADGTISAFANMLAEFQLNEVTIDMMRHRDDAVSGTMDFLFVNLFLWAQEEGYDTFNLGLSPLAGVGAEAGDPVVERAFHFMFENTSRFYDFKGLHRFKSKFRPSWSPRYLAYPGAISLLGVLHAILRAQSGGAGLLSYLR